MRRRSDRNEPSGPSSPVREIATGALRTISRSALPSEGGLVVSADASSSPATGRYECACRCPLQKGGYAAVVRFRRGIDPSTPDPRLHRSSRSTGSALDGGRRAGHGPRGPCTGTARSPRPRRQRAGGAEEPRSRSERGGPDSDIPRGGRPSCLGRASAAGPSPVTWMLSTAPLRAVVAFVVAFAGDGRRSSAVGPRSSPAPRRSATVGDRRFSDSKACEVQASVGSNPTATATYLRKRWAS
jgi:hypothetical protein